MLKRKGIFFDADGTVSDIIKGVPDSAKKAIRQCQNNGHAVFLCTGRSRALIDEPLLEIGFDGIIASAGAYLEKQGQVLYNKELSCQDAEQALEVLLHCGLIPVMEGKDYMYYDLDQYTNEVDWFASQITKMLGDKHRPIKGNEKWMHINKISAKVVSGADAERAIRGLAPWFDPIVHESSGFAGGTIEFIPHEYSKALGVAVVSRLWDIPREDTIVFGDSNNDLEMFQYGAMRVAMGNASPKLMELADYVTEDMFHDGIANALKWLGLI